ncbi:MAG: metallophosphoesterase family protein [Acidobacteriota bacterium]|jgi:predicted phosphodiesterase
MPKRRRYLIISDIHANHEALKAVVQFTKRRRYEGIYFLGDLVGYGASPNPVTTYMRRHKRVFSVRGNHDKVASGLETPDNFNAAAKHAAEWTLQKLTPENMAFLKSLPEGPLCVDNGVALCHGSYLNEDAYLFSDFDGFRNFEAGDFKICFFGHTHFPCVLEEADQGMTLWPLKGDLVEIPLLPGARYMINPGSVGQPRDRNPHASFGEYYPDAGRFVLHRVPYDVKRAAERIRKARLPENLANRLFIGT